MWEGVKAKGKCTVHKLQKVFFYCFRKDYMKSLWLKNDQIRSILNHNQQIFLSSKIIINK
ncbi:MAG: hypothetical protein C0403_04595 [Desulfobacterium sp.]|nr:hypothetical protein [Desulfobacterium sp.]